MWLEGFQGGFLEAEASSQLHVIKRQRQCHIEYFNFSLRAGEIEEGARIVIGIGTTVNPVRQGRGWTVNFPV